MINTTPDLLIVGAGPAGCVIAERAATLSGWSSIIIDKRSHIAGNCYDSTHSSGVYIHNYGPHCFRTNNIKIIEYLSHFTDWIPGNYVCKSYIDGKLYPFPINRKTLEQFFNKTFSDERDVENFLKNLQVPHLNPENSEELVLSNVGHSLFKAFYEGYTTKQWGLSPAHLDPSVCARIPVRFNYDDRYVDHKYQIMPAKGFTQLFKKMTTNDKINICYNLDYNDVRSYIKPKIATVYCGAIDDFFDFRIGKLPWRSLNFEFKEFQKSFIQPCLSINYPNEYAYTRTAEVKHITGQKCDTTVISYEYPTASGDPYYPVINSDSRRQLLAYQQLANVTTKNVYFTGRLGLYTYLNTDQVIETAITTYEKIINNFSKNVSPVPFPEITA